MTILIPEEIFGATKRDVEFFEKLSHIPSETLAEDSLGLGKVPTRAALLETYIPLAGKKVLEIGSGYGVTLASLIKDFGVDGYGVEPASLGFGASYELSRKLFEVNGLDANRIIDAAGEDLPFPDESFDVVYSFNVLEHVSAPLRVLEECTRVLKPGGIIHMEFPNFMSYYETHYSLFQLPIPSRRFLSLWVRLFGRDPAFVRTLQMMNPIWCRWAVRRVSKRFAVNLVSDGSDVFLERLARPYQFRTELSGTRLGRLVALIQMVNRGNWIGRLIVALQGHHPIFLTVRREHIPRV